MKELQERILATKIFPVFDLLEQRLHEGCYISHQEDFWILFRDDGESVCHGKSIREMLVNLIFMDC